MVLLLLLTVYIPLRHIKSRPHVSLHVCLKVAPKQAWSASTQQSATTLKPPAAHNLTTSLRRSLLEKPKAVTSCAGCWPFALNAPWRWSARSTVPPPRSDDTPPSATHYGSSQKQPQEAIAKSLNVSMCRQPTPTTKWIGGWYFFNLLETILISSEKRLASTTLPPGWYITEWKKIINK